MKRITAVVLVTGGVAMGSSALAQDQKPSLRELLDEFQTTNSARQLEVGKQQSRFSFSYSTTPRSTITPRGRWGRSVTDRRYGRSLLCCATVMRSREFRRFKALRSLARPKPFRPFAPC